MVFKQEKKFAIHWKTSLEWEKVFDKTEKPWNYLTNEYDRKNLTWLFGDEKGGIFTFLLICLDR